MRWKFSTPGLRPAFSDGQGLRKVPASATAPAGSLGESPMVPLRDTKLSVRGNVTVSVSCPKEAQWLKTGGHWRPSSGTEGFS